MLLLNLLIGAFQMVIETSIALCLASPPAGPFLPVLAQYLEDKHARGNFGQSVSPPGIP